MNFEQYKNQLPYPKRPVHPMLKDKPTIEEAKDFVSKLADYQNEEADFLIRKKAYNDEDVRLLEKFKDDLFNELGIEDNPKRELLYSKAWGLGHSAGLSEVYHYAFELVDLIV